MGMTDASFVDAQYGDETRLDARRSVWRDSEDGRNPTDLAARALAEALPHFDGPRTCAGATTVFMAR